MARWCVRIHRPPLREARAFGDPACDTLVRWYRGGEVYLSMTLSEITDAVLAYDPARAAPSAKPTPDAPPAASTREDRILEALRTYDGRRSKRRGWPWLRPLRAFSGISDISVAERKRLWRQLKATF